MKLTELQNLASGLPWASLLPQLELLDRRRPATETVLVVHGTFANPSGLDASSPHFWWRSGGSFCKKLDAALDARGSAARCWLHSDVVAQSRDDRMPTFSWSGDNSEVARRLGARELAEQLERLEKHPGIRRYHLVAHSHGGNVVRRALRLLPQAPAKLGEVISMGTPFLHFADDGLVRRWLRRVHWPLAFMTAPALWLAWPTLNKADASWQQVVIVLVLSGVSACLWQYTRRTRENRRPVEGHYICFQHDEAVALLRKSARLAVAPEKFLREIFSAGDTAEAPAGRRRLARLRRWWNTGPREWTERFVAAAPRVPWVGGIAQAFGVGLLLLLFRPYRPGLRLFFSSRLPFFRRSFFHFIENFVTDPAERNSQKNLLASLPGSKDKPWWEAVPEPFSYYALFGHAVAALAPAMAYFVFVPFDWLLGGVAWLADVASRFTLWLGLRVAAKSAFDMDVLGAAFAVGKSCAVPPGFRAVAIEESVEAEILQKVNTTPADVGARLRSLLAAETGSVLVEEVRNVFANVDLMHSQYYQDDRIVAKVADLICGRPPAAPAPARSTGESSVVKENAASRQ